MNVLPSKTLYERTVFMLCIVDSSSAGNEVFVTVEDVTMKYTDNATAVLERRLLDGVNHSYIQTEISKLNYQEKVDLS